ncbi:hypothetical protein SFA35_09635 [Pseudomonas sp. HR96]|uniref:hypothetical protein n=1 Tax=Pseudomonas sp. HR96 TaxID=1027966 RepID=UPI002A7634E8|nr:hypothetical protein [Pseudomonas sp. HR96]WPP01585.1 hypothetical protein SFA35_09635 [Pseudomonas sp. HR96]
MQSEGRAAADSLVLAEITAALGDSISPCDRLAHWTLRWALARGQLTCNRCGASQPTRRAGEPFEHRSACTGSDEHRYPLQELKGLLGHLPGQPVPTANDWQTGRRR